MVAGVHFPTISPGVTEKLPIVVSIPRRYPRSSLAGLTGINSMRSSYTIAATFWPGLSDSLCRIFLGITTWNLGEMVTVLTVASDRSPHHHATSRSIHVS
jgi:hypothetical protein